MNALKVAVGNLFQMTNGSGNVKMSDARGNTFDTVMKQNMKKTAFSNTDSTSVSDRPAIATDTASGSDLKVTQTVDGNTDKMSESPTEGIMQESVMKDTKEMVSVADDDKMSEGLIETMCSFLEELSENIQNIIKKDMDLDEEDIQEILGQMGITLPQLVDTSNLQQFVLQNAKEDISAFLTDETLTAQFNQLADDVNEICIALENSWDISKTDIMALTFISDNEQILQQNVNDMNFQNVLEEVGGDLGLDNEIINDLLEKVATMKKNMAEHSNVKTDTDVKQVENQAVSDFEQAQEGSFKQDFIVVETEDSGKETDNSRQQQSGRQPETKENIVTQFVQELAQAHMETEENVSFSQTEQLQQMREIVTQVVEQIKVVVKADTSSMEVQLNPEKLGKVNLSVVSKNGQMTASFVTENEMAKVALESQMQSLKDTLQNQGLKVEAIEVSVSDFKFEQSSNMNEEQQRQSENNQKKAPRKIDLSMLEDGFDDLSEEDTLAAQIMIDNGNMVDYTA